MPKKDVGAELFEALQAARKVIRKTRAGARAGSCTSNIPYRELGDTLKQINRAIARSVK